MNDGPLNTDIPLQVYLRDENFVREVEVVRVPDGHVALHFVDERFAGVLEPGEHAYWKVFRSHEFRRMEVARGPVSRVIFSGFRRVSALFMGTVCPTGEE